MDCENAWIELKKYVEAAIDFTEKSNQLELKVPYQTVLNKIIELENQR